MSELAQAMEIHREPVGAGVVIETPALAGAFDEDPRGIGSVDFDAHESRSRASKSPAKTDRSMFAYPNVGAPKINYQRIRP